MIDLYTSSTPNGRKVSIALEEMGLPYNVIPLDLKAGDQKQPAFLRINPNGRIPAIVDRDAGDLAVFESGAILIHLAERSGKFLPRDVVGRSITLQWLMWQMGGLGPMQGQAHVFVRYFPERIPAAIERYQAEVRRLYGVMDTRLAEADYLAGDYSIADMACYPWIAQHDWAGVPLDRYEHLQAWFDRIGRRPAVVAGMVVPEPPHSAERTIESARSMLVRDPP